MRSVVNILILGGGINGTAIAMEAAERGLQVALIDTADLASATSSASSKLIHGGLRYLAQGHIKLVRESLRERECLLKNAPHLVTPLTFILPTGRYGLKTWQAGLGLWLYDRLAGIDRGRRSRRLQTPGYSYVDAWGDDARLVVSNALAAAKHGAAIHTYVGSYQITREADLWHIAFDDARLSPITAKVLVNATGPWASQVLTQSLGLTSPYTLTWVQGSHIVVPRFIDTDVAYTLTQPDGRIVFVIPYLDKWCMVGTTEVPYQGDPRQAAISQKEQDYLFTAVARYFNVVLDPASIIWAFSGVRPLVTDGRINVSKTSREDKLYLDTTKGLLLSVFGGKLTTNRALAERAIDKLKPYFPYLLPSISAHTPLPGGDFDDREALMQLSMLRYPWLPSAILQRYVKQYGTRVHTLLADKNQLADLGRDFGAGLYEQEVRFLCDTEWAKTADDILWRRTKLGLDMSEAERVELVAYMSI